MSTLARSARVGSHTRSRGGRRGAPPRGRAPGKVVLAVLGIVALVALGIQIGLGSPSEAQPVRDAAVWSGGRVRVEVENAGEVTGMAKAATDQLRAAGFDVVHFGNASTFDHERASAVVDRVGRTDVARAVADALGIDNVQSDPDPNLYVDVTVVLGRDWSDSNGASGEASASARAVWDPRRWIGR